LWSFREGAIALDLPISPSGLNVPSVPSIVVATFLLPRSFKLLGLVSEIQEQVLFLLLIEGLHERNPRPVVRRVGGTSSDAVS
jgi:hypothetical protein